MLLETGSYFPSRTKSKSIYIGLCGLCLTVICFLPFLKINLSITNPGIIRPCTEVYILYSIHSGRIKEYFLRENMMVQKGDLMYTIENEALTQRQNHSIESIALKDQYIIDLKTAIGTSYRPDTIITLTGQLPTFVTLACKQSYLNFLQKIAEAHVRSNKAKNDLRRQLLLYQQRVIPDVEFESFKFEFEKSQNDIIQIIESIRSQWHGELKLHSEEKRELEQELRSIQKEKEELFVRAPVRGTLMDLAGIYPGSYVHINQKLGQISPDTSLRVIAYLPPNDIGLIHKGMQVIIQVDAFQYNQWGTVTGHVLELSQDIRMIDNKPLFEVRCSLDKDYLQLRSGQQGFLKKGMTLKARFMVTQRSLWQLLYDKLDVWVNPNL